MRTKGTQTANQLKRCLMEGLNGLDGGEKLGRAQARCLALGIQCQRHWVLRFLSVGQRNSSSKTLKGSGTALFLYYIWIKQLLTSVSNSEVILR